jgi:hypothetical protein
VASNSSSHNINSFSNMNSNTVGSVKHKTAKTQPNLNVRSSSRQSQSKNYSVGKTTNAMSSADSKKQ